MAPALIESFAKLIKEGREEGLEKGRLVGEIQTCERFLSAPVSAESTLRQLSIEALKKRAKDLEAEIQKRR